MRATIRHRSHIDQFRCVDTYEEITFSRFFQQGNLFYIYQGNYIQMCVGKEDITFHE